MKKEVFGTVNGQEVYLVTLENKNGMQASITNYGANLVKLLVPDVNGKVEDVVLGFEDASGYEVNPSFFGAVITPSANRIAGASFSLDGTEYPLKKNNGENNLHSDEAKGSHKRIWDMKTEGESLILSIEMEDMDMGFPGNKKFVVTYSLSEDNALSIHYEGCSDKNTIINPTNHSYFNLKGHKEGDIMDHTITLLASQFTPADAASIPTGEIASVENTPMDLRGGVLIGEKIDSEYEQLQFAAGYDHNWVTDDYTGAVRKVATVTAPDAIRTMEVYTDLPGIQFYAGNFIDEQDGKEGAKYGKRSGLALETQCYPDSIHKENFPCVVYGPGKDFQSTTIYKFV